MSLPNRAQIDLIVYDFDGVMTDHRVTVREDGTESVTVHRGDGLGVARIRELGLRQMILSTEQNPVVAARAKKLKLEIIHSVEDKRRTLSEYLQSQCISPERVLYIGNDINDLDCMLSVGFRGCPADAEPEILGICQWVSAKNGGYGVIRELFRALSDAE
jgi:YrbI family 3-deoxy-D-manno-octulosonate 8-phosphate phosphatase